MIGTQHKLLQWVLRAQILDLLKTDFKKKKKE